MTGDAVDIRVLQMSHISEDGKYEHSSSEAGACIYNASDQGIPKMSRVLCENVFVCMCMCYVCVLCTCCR